MNDLQPGSFRDYANAVLNPPQDDEPEMHAPGCICADCSDAELTAEND